MTDNLRKSPSCDEFLEQRMRRIEKLARSELRKKGCTDPDVHAGDVLGEVTIKVIKNWDQLRSPEDAINVITIRTARTHAYQCRRESPQEISDDATPSFQSPGAVDPRQLAEQAIFIKELLARLDEIDDKIFRHRFQGFTWDQIGEIMGMPGTTVRSRYHRAVGELRRTELPRGDSVTSGSLKDQTTRD